MDIISIQQAVAQSAAGSRAARGRLNSLLKGYSLVADLNRPFYSMTANPYDAGVSQMVRKRHIATTDATDLVIGYANWQGASITTNGPAAAPIYVRAGFGHIADGDVFQATFNGGKDTEVRIDPGRMVFTDPIAGSSITTGTPFYLGTYTRLDVTTATVTTASGSNQLTALASQVGTFYVGQWIKGTGIPTTATITAVSGTTLTISANATASATGIAVSAYGQIPCHAIGYDIDGDRFTNSQAGVLTLTTDRTADPTLLSWNSKNTNTGNGAGVILGRRVGGLVRVIAAEVDSIGAGANDNTPTTPTASGSYQRLGWVERTWADDGVMICGVGGSQKSNFLNAGADTRSQHIQRLVSGATGVIFETGTNDVANWHVTTLTVDMLKTRFIKDWRKMAGDRDLPGWQCTILPRTAATGDFLTLGAQTLSAFESARLAINDWLRDGAPVNSDLSPAATGASGGGILRAAYLSWNGTNWTRTAKTGAHPLALGGIFEAADAVESSRNSGKWSIVNAPLTADGTHPLPVGHNAIIAWLNQTGADGASARSIIRDSCSASA